MLLLGTLRCTLCISS